MKIEFIFNHINLSHIASQSHGYIAYKIKPKSNVIVGDIIPNNANIYFDFNAPITTNTANTEIIATLGITDNTLLDFSLYPSPTKNILTINSKTAISSIKIYNKLGQLVLSNINQNKIDTSVLNNGIYFCKVKDTNGYYGIVNFIKE